MRFIVLQIFIFFSSNSLTRELAILLFSITNTDNKKNINFYVRFWNLDFRRTNDYDLSSGYLFSSLAIKLTIPLFLITNW